MNTNCETRQRYLRLSRDVIAESDHRTAMVAYTLASWSRHARKQGKDTFFRSAEELAKDTGGISPGTVRTIIRILSESKVIQVIPGTKERPKPRYRVQKEWEDRILNSDRVLLAGKEDLERWGYPAALVAVNLECMETSFAVNGIIPFETSRAVEVLKLTDQQVQKAIRILKDDGIIEEGDPDYRKGRMIRKFRFIPDNGRKRVTGGGRDVSNDSDLESSISDENLGNASSGLEEKFPEPDMTLEAVESNDQAIDSSSFLPAPAEPEWEQESAPSNEEFLQLLDGNLQKGRGHPEELSNIRATAERILEDLDLGTVQSLLPRSEDQLLGFFEDRLSTTSVPDEERDLMLESLVLSISLRTNPAAHSSSPAIRRMAHSLSFLLGRILESAYEAREQMLSQLKKGFFAREDLNPDEKVKHLKDAVSKINKIGVPVPVGSYRCVNPRIERNFIQPGCSGWKSATGHFREHRESTVAAINRLLIKSGKVPPPPQDGFDRFRLTRSARNLSSLFHNLTKIEQESACNLDR